MTSTQLKLLQCLTTDCFRSGVELAASLNLSKAAIHYHMNKLQQSGIDIYRVPGKGYKLAEATQLLDQQLLKQKLHAIHHPVTLHYFETIDSTNKYLKAINQPGVQLCVAEHQTKGRGRLGRVWQSRFGANIMCSVKFPFQREISKLAGMSLVCGLAVHDVVQPIINQAVQLKWPNDVLVQGAKIAGILIELSGDAYGTTEAIIGIGLNVNQHFSAQEVEQQVTSLFMLTNQAQQREAIVSQLCERLIIRLTEFDQQGFTAFKDEWNEYDYFYGETLVPKQGIQFEQGLGTGVNDEGGYRVKLTNGDYKNIHSGEVSIRIL